MMNLSARVDKHSSNFHFVFVVGQGTQIHVFGLKEWQNYAFITVDHSPASCRSLTALVISFLYR